MNLIAKPIVKGEYWVVTDGDKKVGNVIANNSGFDVKLNGSSKHFKTTGDVRKKTKIEFQTIKTNKTKIELPFATHPTPSKIYNSLFDVKRKIHLFTKTLKSKCYHAAGYYVINQTGQNEVIFCPKYIFIQRYPYIGPFKTEDEAKGMINSL